MWIITKNGFVSMVVDKHDPSLLQVRSRVAEDITKNFPGAEVFTAAAGDYRYRARVKRTEVAIVLAQQVLDMDYISHFKDVALRENPTPAGRATAYYACWGAMARMQDYAPYSKLSRVEEAKLPKRYTGKGGALLPYFSEGYDDYSGYGHTGTTTTRAPGSTHPNSSRWDTRPDTWESYPRGEMDLDPDIDTPDIDTPEDDEEIEEAIKDAEQLIGKVGIDALSEDEWEDLLEDIVLRNRETARAKIDELRYTARHYTPQSASSRRRNRRNKRRRR